MTATIEATLQEYFDGLYHSDTDRLRRVFHPQAVYASATGGSSSTARWTSTSRSSTHGRRPPPATRPAATVWCRSNWVGPVTAVARVECSIGPKRFDDVLTLVRLDDRWQIIAKVFHYELAEEA